MVDGPIARAFVEIEADTDQLRASAQPGFEALEAAARDSADDIADAFERAGRRIRTSLASAATGSQSAAGQLRGSANQIPQAFNQAFNQVDRRSAQSFGFIRRQMSITASAVATSGFFALLAGGVGGPGFAVKLAADIEQLQIGIANLVGAQKGITDLNASMQASAGIFDEIATFAQKTPFSFQGVAQNFQQLLAAGRPLAGVFEDLNAIGGVSAALGVKPDEIQFVIRALAQINSSTKVYQQDLNQITQRFPGFNARQELAAQLAEQLGISVQEASKKISEGAITGKEGVDLLLKAMTEFGPAQNALEAQLNSLTGQWERFKEVVQLSVFDGIEPFLPSLKDSLSAAIPEVKQALDQLIPSGAEFVSGLAPGLSAALDPLSEILAGFFQGINAGLPAVERFFTALSESAPSIGDALGNLAEGGLLFLDVLTAMNPLLQLAADLIAALPPQFITLVAALAGVAKATAAIQTFNIALGGLVLYATGSKAGAIGLLATQVTRLVTAWRAAGPLGFGAGLVGAVSAIAIVAETESESGFLATLAGSIIKLGDSITGFGSRRTAKVTEEMEALIGGFDVNDLGERQAAIERLINAAGEIGNRKRVQLGPVDLSLTNDEADNAARFDAINKQVAALNQQARAEIEAGIETGRFTDEQVAATKAQTDREKPASAITRQLELLQIAEEKANAEAKITIDRYSQVAAQFVATGDSLNHLREVAPEVAGAVQNLRLGVGDTEENFLDFILAADAASLSEEDLATAAALAGISVEDLGVLMESTTQALDDFVAAGLAGLPSMQDVLEGVRTELQEAADAAAELANQSVSPAGNPERDAIKLQRARNRVTDANRKVAESEADLANAAKDADGDSEKLTKLQLDRQSRLDSARLSAEDAALSLRDAELSLVDVAPQTKVTAEQVTVSVQQFAAGLQEAADSIAGFRGDLKVISDAGFADVAGLLAETGLEAGAGMADAIATALASGNTELAKGLQTSITNFKTETSNFETFLREELGPRLIIQMGLIGSALATSFGQDLDFGERIRIAGEIANLDMSDEGKAIAAIAAVEGANAAREYGEALKLDEKTIQAGLAAGKAIENGAAPGSYEAGGTADSFAYLDGAVKGFEDANKNKELQEAAKFSAGGVLRAWNEGLGIASPSKFAKESGFNFMRGMALGITGGEADVNAAMMRASASILGGLPQPQMAGAGVAGSSAAASVSAAGFRSSGPVMNIERLEVGSKDDLRATELSLRSVARGL